MINVPLVLDPNFINFSSLVRVAKLDFGTNLGYQWQTGLSTKAVWRKTSPDTTNQNGKWLPVSFVYKRNGEK